MRRRRDRRLAWTAHALPLLALVAIASPASAKARAKVGTPPTDAAYVTRLERQAILLDLNGRLLSGSSATRTLETWCAAHRLAARPAIVADRILGQDKPIAPEQRRRLMVGDDEPIRYRRVRLRCGDRILSEADNWYVPSRLTAAMNASLDAGDTPFGLVVAPLGTSRRTVEARLLWQPLDAGWDMAGRPANRARYPTDGAIPEHLIEHRALVLDRSGTPIAEVVEHYTGHLLDFVAPQPEAPR